MVRMKLNAPTLRKIAVTGFALSVIGGWMMLSDVSLILGAVSFMVGAFLFLFGGKGHVLLLEKDIKSMSNDE